MKRIVAGLLGLSLGVVVWAGAATAQDGTFPATGADLPETELADGRGRDGREVARGDDGDSITYTIVEAPDPTAANTTTLVTPTPPDLSRVPVSADSGETTMAPPVEEPAPAPSAGSPPPAPADEATAMSPDPVAAPPVSCLDFVAWYDAQVYYESAGGVSAAPALVSSLDSDLDGVACETLIVYS